MIFKVRTLMITTSSVGSDAGSSCVVTGHEMIWRNVCNCLYLLSSGRFVKLSADWQFGGLECCYCLMKVSMVEKLARFVVGEWRQDGC